MFDTESLFRAQFEPYGDDFVYYRTRRSGGVLVGASEFEELIRDYRQSARWSWRRSGTAFGLILGTVITAAVLDFRNAEWVAYAIVACMIGWPLYRAFDVAFLAPRRLTAGRAEVVPPRSGREVRRAAVAALPWSMIVAALLISLAIIIAYVAEPPSEAEGLVWLAGALLLFCGYAWIAVRKLTRR